MGNRLGNIMAMCMTAPLVLLALNKFNFSATAFGYFSYAAFGILFLLTKAQSPTRSSVKKAFQLDDQETSLYLSHHTFILYPLLGRTASAFLNALRLAGIVWGVAATIKGHPIFLAYFLGYYFLTNSLIYKLDPLFYLNLESRKQNQTAIQALKSLNSVLLKAKSPRLAYKKPNASIPDIKFEIDLIRKIQKRFLMSIEDSDFPFVTATGVYSKTLYSKELAGIKLGYIILTMKKKDSDFVLTESSRKLVSIGVRNIFFKSLLEEHQWLNIQVAKDLGKDAPSEISAKEKALLMEVADSIMADVDQVVKNIDSIPDKSGQWFRMIEGLQPIIGKDVSDWHVCTFRGLMSEINYYGDNEIYFYIEDQKVS